MKTLISAIAVVAVSATASFAGNFSISQAGNANGKLWQITSDQGQTLSFYGTTYVHKLQAEISAKNTTISQLQALAIDNSATISALRTQVADLEAQLAVAMAAAPVEAPTPDSAEVSTLMETIANSSVGSILSESAINQFVRTGVVAGGSIEGITAYDAEAGAALQELRDIRVAAVEAGMAHDAYVGLDNANVTDIDYTQVVDSNGVAQDESGVSFTINGKSFSSTYVTEDGATLGKTFGIGESAVDWVDGFEEGYNAGYDDGYADGFADGYAAGVSDSQ